MESYGELQAQLAAEKEKSRLLEESRNYWFEQYKTTAVYTRSKVERAVLDCIVHTFENDPQCAQALLELQQRVLKCIEDREAHVISGAPAAVFGGAEGAEVFPVTPT